ncbi:helix-turn-helix transcriptional regulator [Ruegeria sp. Alg231-54]|uniref:ArsR/SmtB family transcription factor n=1 Tax=Ruegeria sp. Alg231-54 TaxID=1922221 RepID=UPI000D551DE9|nr:metalloregulator ArsR/SmtB family transcription factor [Ruegeria sp. Alg231-54]
MKAQSACCFACCTTAVRPAKLTLAILANLDKPASNSVYSVPISAQILYHLTSGEKTVTELQTALTFLQSWVSQQLSRLRLKGLVSPRRDGKSIYYRLSDDRAQSILAAIQDVICGVAIET